MHLTMSIAHPYEEVLIQISCLAQRAATVKCLLTSLGVAMFGKLCPRVSFQVSSDTACQKKFIVSLVAFERFFSWVNFQTSSQGACQNRRKVALVAFVLGSEFSDVVKLHVWTNALSHWLHFYDFFSRASFQMSSQAACQNRCIVTLVAFEWLFSSVSFQMFPQIVWVNSCEVALVA